MPKSAQKSLNSLAVNWVPLSVIMLLGMPNWYIISDEFYHLSSCNGGDGLDFDPFCEFIQCYRDVCDSTFVFFEWTYQIKPPCWKRPSDGYGLKLMRWHMLPTSKKLALFTTVDQRVGIRYDSGPVEPMPVWFAYKRVAPTWLPQIPM
jgi:hypothetical protein